MNLDNFIKHEWRISQKGNAIGAEIGFTHSQRVKRTLSPSDLL